jgi:cell division protein FtsX
MASPLAVPTALGVTSLLAAGTFALSFAVDPAERSTIFDDLAGTPLDYQTSDLTQWADGIELIVFMRPEATVDQIQAIDQALRADERVDDFVYFDQQDAFREFSDLFADKPELLESVGADTLPPSVRVAPSIVGDDAVAALGAPFEVAPGVREVTYATEAVRDISAIADARAKAANPAFLDRNSDWVLRVVAAAMLVPIALLVVAVKRHPTLTTTIPTPEVH